MNFPIQTNKSASGNGKHHLGYWLIGIALLLAFVLADTAAVALPAMALSPLQLLAGGVAFVLIAGGLLFTVWRFE